MARLLVETAVINSYSAVSRFFSPKPVTNQHLRTLRNEVVARWKWLLSFGKADWSFDDYPITIRKQVQSEADSPSRLKLVLWSASVVKWYGLRGSGDTKAAALADLERHFDQQKVTRSKEEKGMPRPGTHVPLEFAANERVEAHRELADDFIKRVLELDWAWISDESSLWDFHGDETNDALNRKVKDVYGADISDIESARLYEIFERIARGDKDQRWR